MQFPPCKESLRDIFGSVCYHFPEVITMRDIGKNIRDLRQQKNMTQDTLAEQLFVTRQTVSNYETGRTRPDVEMVIKMAEILETDANTILYGIPTTPERKADIRKLLFAAPTLIVFLPLYWWAARILLLYQNNHYIIWPKLMLEIFVSPLPFLLAGWTMLQAISTFTKLAPVENRYIPRIISAFFLFYLAVMIPFAVSIFTQIELPKFWNYLVYGLLGVLPVRVNIFEPRALFFLLGMLLWLFRLPRK